MPTEYATRVEQLDRKHPGLRQLIDLMLDGHGGLAEIREAVKEKFGEEIATSTLGSYKLKRWRPRRDWIDAIKNRAQAFSELISDGKMADIQQAQLFEQIQAAMDDGARLDPEFAMSEQRKLLALQLKREQLDQEKKKLELQIERARRELKEATDEAERKLKSGEALTIDDINRVRSRVFGLPPKVAASS